MARLVLLAGMLALAGCAPAAPILTLPPLGAARPAGSADSVRYVIHISVDGLRPDAVERFDGAALPAFARLRREGAWTHNARTDADLRKTLPAHTDQITGRAALGPAGHGWTVNTDPAPGVTIHSNHGSYVASVFDVVHDAGRRTGAFVSKSKFSLVDLSYDADHGAPDTTGPDDGRDKIDTFVYASDTAELTDQLLADEAREPFAYAFLHLRDPDATGHWWGWSVRRGSHYLRAVQRADVQVGRVLALVDRDPRLRGRTVVIVTSDHGGTGHSHYAERPRHFTVPFYVWGAGVAPSDLYADTPETRQDPGAENVGWDALRQPVRNGDAANLALALLGLPPVPGSTIGTQHPLRVSETPRSAP